MTWGRGLSDAIDRLRERREDGSRLSEAIARLREHVSKSAPRFDARDREALDYVLTFAEDIEADSKADSRVQSIVSSLPGRRCPCCERPTLRYEGPCARCEP